MTGHPSLGPPAVPIAHRRPLRRASQTAKAQKCAASRLAPTGRLLFGLRGLSNSIAKQKTEGSPIVLACQRLAPGGQRISHRKILSRAHLTPKWRGLWWVDWMRTELWKGFGTH